MITVHKFPLESSRVQYLRVPMGSKILKIHENPIRLGHYDCYVQVSTDTLIIEPTVIWMFGTGHEIPNEDIRFLKYIDTVFTLDGFVWHFYRDKRNALV